jgi:hypothetical protein
MDTVKIEFFNPDAMQMLLRHTGLDYGTKQHLQKYFKRRENGNRITTIYHFCKDYASYSIGRLYADHGLSLVGFSREVRNALAKGLYWDVDMVNCHAVILTQLCRKHGWKCDGLTHYVQNRDDVMNDIMTHYGCSNKDAKNLMIRLMFLGHPEAWVGDSVCESFTNHLPYIEGLKGELNQIASNVWSAYPEVSGVVSRKKKKTQQAKLSSCLSLVLQSEEHKILMSIDDSLKSQGRSMDTFIFDGGLVRRLKDETELPESILRQCEDDVKHDTNYDIKLVVKELTTTFEINETDNGLVSPDIIIDDLYAAKEFVKMMGDRMVYTDDTLYVFDETTGLWSKEDTSMRYYINKYENKLKFRQLNLDTGKEKVFNYSGIEKNLNNMLKFVPTFCMYDDFFNKNIDTSRGKWLFSNGIYDLETNTFTPEFNPSVVFKDRINRPFPTERKHDVVKLVTKILFQDPFMNDEMEASDYLRIAIMRALYGDYRAKQFYFCVGKSNAGKGVLADALKASFGGYIGTFNAKSLAYNDNSTADAAKQLSWVFGIKDKRMAISSEISMSKAFDGNLLKSLASGGDEVDARKNHQDEVKVINRSTMFCFNNDIPLINPLDDGCVNRIRCVEFNCVFKNVEDVAQDFERVADKDIKDKFEKDADFQDALVWIMIDAFNEFKHKGHLTPETVTVATKEWTGDTGSVGGLLDIKYEITRNETDFIPAREIIDFLTKEKQLKMSDTKIGRELSSLKLVKANKKLKGKTVRVWVGLKIRGDGYEIDDDYY